MRQIQVLESTILHASDQIFWLDGSSAADVSAMRRVARPLQLELSQSPRDLAMREGTGKFVFWRRAGASVSDGVADDSDKAFTTAGTYTLAGTVSDPGGHYLPRRFSVTAGNNPPTGHALTLYPAPVAVRFNRGGGLRLSLGRAADATPLPWAIVTASISVPGLGTQIYRAQADARGELLLPFLRLPPLAEGIDDYSATLTIHGRNDTSADQISNPDDFIAMELGAPDDASFSQSIGFSAVPGELSTLRSDGRTYLAVQPV